MHSLLAAHKQCAAKTATTAAIATLETPTSLDAPLAVFVILDEFLPEESVPELLVLSPDPASDEASASDEAPSEVVLLEEVLSPDPASDEALSDAGVVLQVGGDSAAKRPTATLDSLSSCGLRDAT